MSLNVSKTLFLVPLLFLLVFSSPVNAKPVAPDPEGTWQAPTTEFGVSLTWENSSEGYSTHADAGVGLNPFNQDPFTQSYFSAGGSAFSPVLNFEGSGPYKVVVDNVRPDERYVYQLSFDSGADRPNSGYLEWDLENSTHVFVPSDYLSVIDNLNGTDFGVNPDINMRAVDNYVFVESDTATLLYENAVNLSVTPDLIEGYAGENVSFDVVVNNTGRYDENYSLSSTKGILAPSSLAIASEGSGTATLSLSLPIGLKEFTVTATGEYATDNSVATAFGPPFSFSLLPMENGALPGENVGFKLSVHNLSDKVDNYSLSASDDADWNPELSNNLLENVAPGVESSTMVYVSIPENENLAGVEDNIVVTVNSDRYPWAEDNENCIARAGFFNVDVSISPDYQENAPGGELSYSVEVSNSGTIDDTFALSINDNIFGDVYWEENIALDNSSLSVQAGKKEVTTLRVLIPDNAFPGRTNEIKVTVTSETDNAVESSDNCHAHVTRLSVSISPDWQNGMPGEEITYTVELRNNEDTSRYYHSSVSSNLGWNANFDIEDITIGPNGVVLSYLHVRVPENVRGGMEDNVTVSMNPENNNFSYSSGCTAHANIVRGVDASITPQTDNGPQGATLEYTVSVTNTGNVEDTYDLSLEDVEGWELEILPSNLTIPYRESDNATLSVKISENAEFMDLDNITVTATSQSNPSISAESVCTSIYSLIVRKLRLDIDWNLVSFPVVDENTTVEGLFEGSGVDYSEVMVLELRDGSLSVVPYDQVLEDNRGYFIKSPSAVTVTSSGVPKSSDNINLIGDWNLVGFPVVDENTTVEGLFENTGVNYFDTTVLELRDGSLSVVPYDQVLEDNRGYYIKPPIATVIACP